MKNTYARVSFFKKETLPQVFSCELCGIFKNTFFTEPLRTTASAFHATDLILYPLSWKQKTSDFLKFQGVYRKRLMA